MLEVTDLTKHYGSLVAVDDLSFRLERGDFATLLGPSGCGKSTTLHIIAGLLEPTDGQVRLRDEDVTTLPPNERNIGLVFQHSALFPHMTVEENLRFGLRLQEFDGDHDDQIDRFLNLVQMAEYGDHKPTELSGGQQRRISLARALAYEPDILLLDEPLTGLDRVLREDMRNEIRKIQEEVGVTTLHVTHDQTEALSMSDRIIVLDEGEKQQEGGPTELYEKPQTPFVADFIGDSTHISGELVTTDPPLVQNGSVDVRVDSSSAAEKSVGDDVSVYVRPERTELLEAPVADEVRANGANVFTGTASRVEYLGNHIEIVVTLGDGTRAIAHADSRTDIEVGDDVGIRFSQEDVIAL
ncbi:putative spermidine/putrescine transport system ATP-binding protein [Natronorubrum sediminis]|uniref:Molybdate/tungstate import ATP-binding protein WtpC n=1 Tax=Natronorubrum sediminis TaxID=640943 RepID=A0A1H6FVJ8_9EURY|nr:ABC transporter ATP-binding protein [Natronorubrum sediminis]SEH14462.1 putative spermidine/putrescine transport system ATP-binding protein [Natronorubrum sediminis]